MMKMIGSFTLSVVLTMIVAYIFFVPPNLPPGYVYIIVFVVFFGISTILINTASCMKKRKDSDHEKDS